MLLRKHIQKPAMDLQPSSPGAINDEDFIRALDYEELEKRFEVHKWVPCYIHNYDYLTPQIKAMIGHKPIYAKANKGKRKTYMTEMNLETGEVTVTEKTKSHKEKKEERRAHKAEVKAARDDSKHEYKEKKAEAKAEYKEKKAAAVDELLQQRRAQREDRKLLLADKWGARHEELDSRRQQLRQHHQQMKQGTQQHEPENDSTRPVAPKVGSFTFKDPFSSDLLPKYLNESDSNPPSRNNSVAAANIDKKDTSASPLVAKENVTSYRASPPAYTLTTSRKDSIRTIDSGANARPRQNSVRTVGSGNSGNSDGMGRAGTLSGKLKDMILPKRRFSLTSNHLQRTASYDQTQLTMTTARGAVNNLMRNRDVAGRRMSHQIGMYFLVYYFCFSDRRATPRVPPKTEKENIWPPPSPETIHPDTTIPTHTDLRPAEFPDFTVP